MPNPYAAILREPGAAAFSLTGLIARLPMSMIGIGIVLVVEGTSGSYALAGAVSAVATVAFALISPQFSRLVDRYGQRRVTTPQLTAYVTALIALVVLAERDAPPWTLFLAALVIGCEPTIGSLVRSRWARALGSGAQLRTAYSWESVLDELVFVVGPTAVTVAAVQFGASAALTGVAAVGFFGGVLFLAQRRTEPPVAGNAQIQRGSMVGEPWMRVLMVIAASLGGIFGCVEVVTIARSEELGNLEGAGLVLGLYALGSLVAGLVYGWRHPTMSLCRQLVIGSIAMAVLTPLFFVAAGSLTTLSLTAFVCGFAISPTSIVSFALIEELAPQVRLTESLTWLITGMALGLSAGAAVSGWWIDRSGARDAYLLAVGCGVLTALIAVAFRRHLAAQG